MEATAAETTVTAAPTTETPSNKENSNKKNSTVNSSLVPKEWPPEVVELYEPVRTLGKGGFGSVLLARRRRKEQHKGSAGGQSNDAADAPLLVAMKIVGNTTGKEIGYAHRELDILAELQHESIVRLLQYWEPPADSSWSVCMALSYAKGPTLESILQYGGKLSMNFARIVAAQLVDAVSYLHFRAVIHRDIKPNNMVITGANMKTQNDIYDDIHDSSRKSDSEQSYVEWNELKAKWHLTLVDFGFARALTPNDMQKKLPKYKPPSEETDPVGAQLDSSRSSISSSRRSLNRSISRAFQRQMSALGTKAYTAPEVMKVIPKTAGRDDAPPSGILDQSVTKTLSDHVSYYGMLVDAYSVGSTIKYMVTGAPPQDDVNELIAIENSPIAVVCRLLCAMCSSKGNSNDGPTERRIQYRPIRDIPPEVIRLIKGTTHPDPAKRTSVRTARLYPWICDVLDTEGPGTQQVEYLSFIQRKMMAEETAKSENMEEKILTTTTPTMIVSEHESSAEISKADG